MIDGLEQLPNAALALVAAVCAALEDTPNGAPAECGLYHTTPPDDCCDFAAVWVNRIAGTDTFPLEKQDVMRTQGCSGVTHPFVEFGIRWMRDCWPALNHDETGRAPFPSHSVIDPIAANLMMEGLAVWCRLYSALANPNSTLLSAAGCDGFWLGPALPRNPRGTCAGWTITLKVDIALPCCL